MAERSSGAHERVVVVGAGMGGLVSALLLAHRGLQVTVVDAQDEPGGKMRQTQMGSVGIDAGPTVFTMPWVFEQIFDEVGCSFRDRVACDPLRILARHAWRDHDRTLDLWADPRESAQAIAEFSSPQEAKRFSAFCAEAARLYRHLEAPYIRSQKPTLKSMITDLGPQGLMALAGLGPLSSLWRSLGRHFQDPRLRQLFARYATYCGASPWQAPATLMLIAQVEMQGVWSVRGGMKALAKSVADLAAERGVSFRWNSSCQQILTKAERVNGVRLTTGEQLDAEVVVFNGDVNALASGLLGEDLRQAAMATPKARRSLSAMTWCSLANTQGWPLVRHNVFFDHHYKSEFDDIFGHGRFPARPTVYVCAQDRLDDGAVHAPADMHGAERLLCLVNAPARGDSSRVPQADDEKEMQQCETRTFELLQNCGLQIRAHQTVRTSPWEFESRFPATGGALYGPATHGWMSAFNRASALSRVPGLFLTGGSTHPGPGVPMAAMSGRIAAETVMAHLGSTSRSARVLISGGISTRSATMGNTA